MVRNIPELLNKILATSMETYEKHGDLGITMFIIPKGADKILEIPITTGIKQNVMEFSRKEVEGIAVTGHWDVSESSIIMPDPSYGMDAVGVVYHSYTEDYFFYAKILQHDIEGKEKFQYAAIKRLSRRDGYKLDEGFLKSIFPVLN